MPDNNVTKEKTNFNENRLEPKRVQEFAHFFKQYMSVSSVVAAALPIPVTAIGLIPIYSAQKPFLSTYTSLFCFLVLGFLFFIRHSLAQRMFPFLIHHESVKSEYYKTREQINLPKFYHFWTPIKWGFRKFIESISRNFVPALPLIFILLAFGSVLYYHDLLNLSVHVAKKPPINGKSLSYMENVLTSTSLEEIPNATRLSITYLCIFIFSEAAFILMAIKEYMQDLLGVTDLEIITKYKIKDKEMLRNILDKTEG